MSKKRWIITVGFGVILALLATASVYWYQVEKAEKARQAEALLEQGITLFDQKKYPEALLKFESVSEDLPEDWRLPYYRGASLMMLKEYQPATTWLEQALILNNKEAGVLYALGVVYYKLGNLALAKGYFASVLEINPNDLHARGLMEIMTRLERESAGVEDKSEPKERDD